jgi:hypothetical protein
VAGKTEAAILATKNHDCQIFFTQHTKLPLNYQMAVEYNKYQKNKTNGSKIYQMAVI